MQDINFEAGVWAVVTTAGGKKLIGSIPGVGTEWIIESIEKRRPITISPAFELLATHMPIQDQHGNVGFRHIVQCAPIDACNEATMVHVIASGVHLFNEMQEEDRNKHKGLVMTLENMLLEARLKAIGIEKPTMQEPRGPIRSS